ncbi:MAG TPA: M1 family aminopeptidase [Gemmatimonadales bacterium]|jgi:aminopeptidase N|nr:M1 family aminopeptidase [Gemmatimonadales bacterium]
MRTSLLSTGLALGLSGAATIAVAQRPTGIVGAYVPPRTWPQEPRRFDLLHQRIELRFDLPHRALFGTVTTRLAITVARTDTLRLDAEHLTIDRATDPKGRALRFLADTEHVTVRLPRPAAVGDTVEFTLQYHGLPERGVYFVPRKNVIWSQGEATETRAWVPTYDAPNDKTTWEFLVTADTGLKVLSNGRLVGVTPVAGGKQNVWHWAQEKPASTYLYSVVVGPFTVLKDQWRGIPVEYWTYPDTVNAAWRSFGETPAMIELYSQLLGVNFPWDKYDQSIIPDFTYGGMENVSATTQTDLVLHPAADEPGGGRGLVAHELAHQWFGDLTTTADWADIWLNEGITTYMESVQNEKTRGWDAGQLSWWQQQQQAMGADRNEQRPLVWGQYRGSDPIVLFFSGHVYPKGAQLAHQLRRLLGDSLFWAGMHRFLVDNAYKPVTTPDYAIAMERTCNCDLDWFFDQWAYGIGYPVVHFTRRWDPAARALDVTVEQTQPIDSLHPLFRFPATLRITTRDGVVRHTILVTKPQETFRIALTTEPLAFRFDEGGWLLGKVTGDQTLAELAAMAMHDLEWGARNWALRQLGDQTDSVTAAARRFIVLNEHSDWLRAVALHQMAHDSNPASLSVVRSALHDPAPDVRGAALRALRPFDPGAAALAAQEIVGHDPSNAVRETALEILAQVKGRDALPVLVAATGPLESNDVRITAARQLRQFRDAGAEDALVRLTAPSEPRDLRGAALRDLAQTGDSARAAATAAGLLDDADPLLAAQAVQVLAQVGGTAGKARLQDALKRETRVTVRSAEAGAVGAH